MENFPVNGETYQQIWADIKYTKQFQMQSHFVSAAMSRTGKTNDSD
jgi:hypothetical protein